MRSYPNIPAAAKMCVTVSAKLHRLRPIGETWMDIRINWYKMGLSNPKPGRVARICLKFDCIVLLFYSRRCWGAVNAGSVVGLGKGEYAGVDGCGSSEHGHGGQTSWVMVNIKRWMKEILLKGNRGKAENGSEMLFHEIWGLQFVVLYKGRAQNQRQKPDEYSLFVIQKLHRSWKRKQAGLIRRHVHLKRI